MRPHVGDVLVFKTLSLNEDTWTPELSSYRTAEVRCDCSRSVVVVVVAVAAFYGLRFCAFGADGRVLHCGAACGLCFVLWCAALGLGDLVTRRSAAVAARSDVRVLVFSCVLLVHSFRENIFLWLLFADTHAHSSARVSTYRYASFFFFPHAHEIQRAAVVDSRRQPGRLGIDIFILCQRSLVGHSQRVVSERHL